TGDRPGVAAVGPVRWVEPLRFLEVLGREIELTCGAQVLTEREVRIGRRFFARPRPAATHDLLGREREAACRSPIDPVAQSDHVSLGVDVQLTGQLDALAIDRRRVRRYLAVLEGRPAWI